MTRTIADLTAGKPVGTVHRAAGGATMVVDPNAMILLGDQDPTANALYMGAGNASTPVASTVADTHFMDFRWKGAMASGDNRGIYNRLYLTSTGGGESFRTMTSVNASVGTAHGAHISLGFGASGYVSGQGIASRNTLHVANTATGTLAATQAELYFDSASGTVASAAHSCLRLLVDGDGTGKATHRNWMSLEGANAASVVAGTVGGTAKGVRILIDGVTHYLTAGTTCS
jgi:hypothetical protein